MDDMEDALEKEKRARVEQDKARRKIESDLKLAQSSIENVERAKKETEASLQRYQTINMCPNMEFKLGACPRKFNNM